MARHVLHLAVPAGGDPRIEVALVLVQRDAGNTDVGKSKRARLLGQQDANRRRIGLLALAAHRWIPWPV